MTFFVPSLQSDHGAAEMRRFANMEPAPFGDLTCDKFCVRGIGAGVFVNNR